MTNFLTAYDAYLESIDADETLSLKQRKQKRSETQSMVLLVLTAADWRGCRGRKATKADVQDARRFMAAIPIGQFSQVRQEGLRYLKVTSVPETSRRVHFCRFKQMFAWMQAHHYWPQHHQRPNIVNDCAPMVHSSFGVYEQQHLTERRGMLTKYRLRPDQFSQAFKEERLAFVRFFTRQRQPGRFSEPIKETTAQLYLQDFDFFAGFCCRREEIDPATINFKTLIAVVVPEEMRALTPAQQKAEWRPLVRELETRLCDYLEFIAEENHAISPRTQYNRVFCLLPITYYLYRHWVETKEDYQAIPIVQLLKRMTDEAQQNVSRWQAQGRYVTPMSDKMPTPRAGQTVLEACRDQILKPQVLACAPRDSSGRWRGGFAMARSLQSAIQMSLMMNNPARRSQDYRSLQVAESCPIQPPETVPEGGFIFPCPPDGVRPRNRDGEFLDNIIFHTYSYQGYDYPDGIWVIQVNQYKTRKRLGVFEAVLQNPTFQNGMSFYNLLETYLMGMWWEDLRAPTVYDWGHLPFQGLRGRWLSAGRMEFMPSSSVLLEEAGKPPSRMGHFFLRPKSGTPFTSASEFASLLSHRAFRLSGKKLTPHTMRYIWATWAGQKQMQDGPLQALAYMMGHSVEILRRMYQKLSSGDYQKIFEDAERDCKLRDTTPSIEQITQWARALARQQQQQLLVQIQALLEEEDGVA